MNEAPAVPEAIGIVAFDMEALSRTVLENGDSIVATFQQKLDRLGAELRGVKAIEENGPSAPLGVANFTGEDGFAGGLAAPIELKVTVANHLNQPGSQCFGRAAQNHVAGRIGGFGFCTQFASLLVHNPLSANNDDVLLQIVDMFNPLDQMFDVERYFRDENDVGPAISGAKGEVAGVTSHHLDNGDAAMTFRSGANAFDALGRDEYGGGVAGGYVIDDLIEVENRAGFGAFIALAAFDGGVVHAHPFVGFTGIIQPEIVINGFGSENRRQSIGQGLEAVQGSVAADADQAVDLEPSEALDDLIEFFVFIRIDEVSGRTDEGSALGGIEFGDLVKQWIQMDMRDAGIEEAVESFNQTDDFDLELIGPGHGALNGGVKGRSITAGGKDADAFHG